MLRYAFWNWRLCTTFYRLTLKGERSIGNVKIPSTGRSRCSASWRIWPLPSRTWSVGRKFREDQIIMASTAVEVRQKRSGFIGNHGGFSVRSGERVDSREGLPKGGNENFDGVRFPPRADSHAEESIELAEFRLDGLFKVAQVGV